MLHISLGIIKVTINSDNMSIVASLSGHLQLLYLADTVFWIKDDNFSTWNIGKTCMAALPVSPDVAVKMTILFSNRAF